MTTSQSYLPTYDRWHFMTICHNNSGDLLRSKTCIWSRVPLLLSSGGLWLLLRCLAPNLQSCKHFLWGRTSRLDLFVNHFSLNQHLECQVKSRSQPLQSSSIGWPIFTDQSNLGNQRPNSNWETMNVEKPTWLNVSHWYNSINQVSYVTSLQVKVLVQAELYCFILFLQVSVIESIVRFLDPSSRRKASEQRRTWREGANGMPKLHPKPPPNVDSWRRPEPVPLFHHLDSTAQHLVTLVPWECSKKHQRHLSSGQRHLPAVSSSDGH